MPASQEPHDPAKAAHDTALRTQAEEKIRSPAVAALTVDRAQLELDFQAQQHELHVHQIELSLQLEELQRNNAELQQMRDVYRDLYALSPVGYFTLSEDGRILEVNRAGCELLRSQRSALLRQRFSAYLDEASSVPFALLLRRAFARTQAGDQPVRAELTLQLPGGGRAEIQLDARAEASREPPYLRAAVTDITALKRAQHDIAELNAGLEQRVQDRTARIQELSEELEAFVQAVTHNLQTPLRQFTGLSVLLRRSMPDNPGAAPVEGGIRREQQTQHYLREMVGSADRMNALVSALSEYFQSGRQLSRSMSVSLDRVLEEVKKELQPQLQAYGVVWHQDPLPTVFSDPLCLKQMFMALLDNALKFSAGQTPPRSAF